MDGARVAVVGLGGLYPCGGPEELWAAVRAGADLTHDVPPGRWRLDPADALPPGPGRPDRTYSRRGCFIDAIPTDPDLPPGLDPLFHLTLFAGRQAWASAVMRDVDRKRVGVVLGAIALPTEEAAAFAWEVLGPGLVGQASSLVPDKRGRLSNIQPVGLPAALLAKALGLGGVCFTLDAACASSLYALKLAADELRAGRADAMLAGGVSRPDCFYTQMGFAQLRALSPSGRAAPFDAGADGLVVGEGAGV